MHSVQNYLLLTFLILSGLLSACNTEKKQTFDPSQAYLVLKVETKLGEGAIWNHKSQELFWVDIEGKTLHIYNPALRQDQIFRLDQRIGTVVPTSERKAVVALEDGIYMMDLRRGATDLLVRPAEHGEGLRFNDGKCDPAGRIWVGSMHLQQTPGAAALYRIDAAGNAAKMLDSVTISNGIVWSSDQKTMYYIDTHLGNVRAFDYDNASGEISNERVVINVPEEMGFPDGMTIDAEDMLWIALWRGQGVGRWNPQTGKLLSKINVPATNVTSVAFGGPELDTLYITTASIDMTAEQQEQFPDAGSLYMAVPGVKGLKCSLFGEGKQGQ